MIKVASSWTSFINSTRSAAHGHHNPPEGGSHHRGLAVLEQKREYGQAVSQARLEGVPRDCDSVQKQHGTPEEPPCSAL